MRPNRSFFQQKTLKVARQLLGCFLIRQSGRKKIVGRIIETEAYCGPKDLASHASKGLTPRTKIMFGKAGHAYVYLIYGMYYCFNIVTEKEGYPAAVLIRGVEVINNLRPPSTRPIRPRAHGREVRAGKTKDHYIIGPGKVCREMKIDKKFNGKDLIKSKKIWVEKNKRRLKDSKTKRLTRVGVDYAGEYKDKKWRFVLQD